MNSGKYYWDRKFEETKIVFSQRPDWMGVFDNDIPSAAFLKGLIEEYKPENILEIGAAAGWSAYYLLDEACRYKDAKMTSIDLSTKLYYQNEKTVGSAFFEKQPVFSDNWNLVTEKNALGYLSQYDGEKFDFVFIDANHLHPWAALDFIAVIPFLKENAIVAFHDVFLNKISMGLMPADWHPQDRLKGHDSNRGPYALYKFLEDEMTLSYDEKAPNIAALVYDSTKKDKYLRKILYSLMLPWEKVVHAQKDNFRFYSLLIEYVNYIENHFEECWSEKFADVLFSSFKSMSLLDDNAEAEKILRRLELLYIARPETKIMFWGASLFANALISNNRLDAYNIIGIIDKSTEKVGTKIEEYPVYHPDDILTLKPEVIIPTAVNYANMSKNIRSYLDSIGYDCMVL